MPLGQPHPYKQEARDLAKYRATNRRQAASERRLSERRRLVSSGSPYPGAETRSRRVSFGKVLERGPSPAYSGPNISAGRADEVTDIVNSGDAGSVDGPSQQIWNEESTTPRRAQSTAGQRYRPITEAYKQEHPYSSFPYSRCSLWERELAGRTLEAQKDTEVCRRVHKLRAQIEDFAWAYTSLVTKSSRRPSVEILCGDISNAKLVRYIGFLAQGGANGLESWRELLTDGDCMIALIVGIIGMALKEHVFAALWFGGTPAQIQELEQLEEEEKEDDGKSKSRQHSDFVNRP